MFLFSLILMLLKNMGCQPVCVTVFFLQNLLQMAEIMLVIPISSAQCERGFSALKRIKSDVRSSLHMFTTKILIHISMEGSKIGAELEQFNSTPSVVKWLNSGQRSRRHLSYRKWPDELISVGKCQSFTWESKDFN